MRLDHLLSKELTVSLVGRVGRLVWCTPESITRYSASRAIPLLQVSASRGGAWVVGPPLFRFEGTRALSQVPFGVDREGVDVLELVAPTARSVERRTAP